MGRPPESVIWGTFRMSASLAKSDIKHAALFLVPLVLLYGGIVYWTDCLGFPLQKDEVHFWPTSLSFSEVLLPTAEQLRSYNELNTPLPFLVFGWIEHFFHAGISAARFFNLSISFAIVCMIGLRNGRPTSSSLLSAIGVLSFPYFIGASMHLYTDIIAAFFAVLGVAAHQRRSYYLAAAFFILGIACRQYILAFPAAILAHEVFHFRRGVEMQIAALASPCVAASSIFGWYIFFGGPAPEPAIRAQAIVTADTFRAFPDHSLYFLSTVGAYFVLPEAILFRRLPSLPSHKQTLLIVVIVAALFLLFPPLSNTNYPIPTMGFMDKAAHLILPDLIRLLLFLALALITCIRFHRPSLTAFLVYTNAAIMIKAHIAWDKYTLPLLVVLWFLGSRNGVQAAEQRAAPGPGNTPGKN